MKRNQHTHHVEFTAPMHSIQHLFWLLAVVLLVAFPSLSEAQSTLVTTRLGPVQPQSGGITRFPRLVLPQGSPPWAWITGCTATTFNGLSAPIDGSQRFAIFNVSALGGALFANVVCEAETLTKITISPKDITLTRYGAQAQLSVQGTFKNGTVQPIHQATVGTTYTSSDPKVASVDPDGTITALTAGTVTISTKNGSQTDTAKVTVQVATPIALYLRPAIVLLKKTGEIQALQAYLLFSDGTQREVTAQTTLVSATPSVANIVGQSVSAVGPGRSIITATALGLSAQLLAKVEGTAKLVSLAATPPTIQLTFKGETQALKVTGTYSDNSTLDLTLASSGIKYASSKPAVATISPDGVVAALADGTTTITISHPALSASSASVAVTVQLATLQQLTVTPTPARLKQVGETLQLKVEGTFTGGNPPTRDLTNNAGTTYNITDPTIATVSTTGLLTALKLGSTTLTVSYDTQQVQVPIQVASRTLKSIAFTRTSLAMIQNTVDLKSSTAQLTLTGTYDDNSTADLTADAQTQYSSSSNAVTVGATGEAFAQSVAGTATITATHQGQQATMSITVTLFAPQASGNLKLKGAVGGVVIRGETAYVAGGAEGLFIVDIKTPSAPALRETLRFSGEAKSLHFAGHHLFVAAGSAGLHIVSTRSSQFVEVTNTIPVAGGEGLGSAFWRDRLYIAGGKAGIVVMDLASFVSPQLIGASQQGDTKAVAVDARWLAAVDVDQVLIYDRQVASWWSKPPTRTIALIGANTVTASASATPGTFFVGAASGLYMVDQTGTKANVAHTGITLSANALAQEDGWLHAAGSVSGGNSVAQFIASNPLNPQYRARFPFTGFGFSLIAAGLDATRGYIAIAANQDASKDYQLQLGRYRQWVDYKTQAPQIALRYPLDNSSQPEDRDLHIEATVSDDAEVDKVEFRVAGVLVATVSNRPFKVVIPGPQVTASTPTLIDAIAYDVAGNTTTSNAVTVNVTPIADTTPPTIALLLPVTGSEVEIGGDLIMRANAIDDKRVAEVRFTVDGIRVATLREPPFVAAYTVPASTVDGTTLKVRAEVIDYGGQSKQTIDIDVLAVKLTPLTADIGESDTSFDNQRVVVRGRTIAIDGSHRFKSLWVDQGGILTHNAATTTKVYQLNVDADYVYIGPKSKIDVTAKGYLAANTGGNGAVGRTFGNTATGGATFGRGGAHGGPGGYPFTTTPPSAMYDAIFHPIQPGGGAGSCSSPDICSGGGVVRIKSKVLLVEGSILADGGGIGANGGGGGSVYITADVLGGKGEISADGGGIFDSSAGPGAGGRIAVYFKSLAGFALSAITARGTGGSKGNGQFSAFVAGGTGTVLTKGPNDTYGILTLDHENPANAVQTTPLPQVGKDVSTGITRDTITRSSANWEPGQLVDHWVNPNTQQTRVYRITANTKTTLTLDVGGDDITTIAKSGDTFHGVLFLDALVLRNRAHISTDDLIDIGANNGQGLTIRGGTFNNANLVLDPNDDLTIDGGQLTIQQPLSVKQLFLRNGATISVIPATTTAFFTARITVAQTLSIDATSQINVTGKGYQVGNLATTGGAGYHHHFQTTNGSIKRAGGSHGGLGEVYFADGQSKAGPTFGRFEDPIEPGGGGSCISFGSCLTGHGGGLVAISAGTLQLDGKIIANGEPGDTNGGGGAGGGVKITTTTLRGTGSIEASGGNAPTSGGYGAGAGGRIAVYYTTLQAFDLATQLKTNPGVQSEARNTPAGAGTIFTKAASQTYGELTIAQHGFPATGFITPLLSIGRGTITALLPNQMTDSNATFAGENQLAGLWLNPDVLKGTLLKVMANNGKDLFTRPLDGSLTLASSVGQTYQGILQLDKLIVSGGARVSTLDELKATTAQVDQTSAFNGRVQKLPACPGTCQISQDCQVFGCGIKTTCLSNLCQ